MESVVSVFGGTGGYLYGRMLLFLVAGFVLTPVVSWFVLRRFRSSTHKLMGQYTGPDGESYQEISKTVNEQRPALRIDVIAGSESTESSGRQSNRVVKTAVHDLRSTALIYIVAGIIYTLPYVTVFLLSLQAELQSTTLFSFGNLLMYGLVFFWPTIVILNLVYATSRRDTLVLLGAYFALFFVGILLNGAAYISPFLTTWLLVNLLPTILVVWFMQRRLSAVVPLLFPFVVFGCAGSTMMLDGFRFLTGSSAGESLGFMLARLIGLSIAVAISYFLLRLFGRLYLVHHFGDLEYLVMSLFLPFWFTQTFWVASRDLRLVLFTFFGLLLYWLVLRAGFAINRRRRPTISQPTFYLLLRVFALGRRSELFFDSFSKLWRRSGVVTMISGPDLVNRLVEPHEFLEYLSGRLSRRFVQGQDDFEERLAQIDVRRDPDGRFRVQEYFCYADSWQMAMQRLAKLSHGILMDLRNFTKQNDGCKFEIATLLNRIDLYQIIFLVDDTTDMDHLKLTINKLWRSVSPDSPNTVRGNPTVRLFDLSTSDPRKDWPFLLDLLSVELQTSI